MVIEELIGVVALVYLVTLAYKAMENYETFVAEYGSLADKFTYISIYFCISQFVILFLIGIYKFINRHTRMIRKKGL